jgi:hypothetical protein
VGKRQVDDAHADALWNEIADCGPRDVQGPTRRDRALSFAGSL